MHGDQGDGAARPTLEETIETIRTATGDAVASAITRGIALTAYPYADAEKPIPLAEELTRDQRRVMEAVATRSRMPFELVRRYRIPDPVQVRRRWLGIDPPGVLEKLVEVPTGPEGQLIAMPVWRALQRGVLARREDDAFRGCIEDALDRVRGVVEIAEAFEPPYGIQLSPRPEYARVGPVPIDDEVRAWTVRTFERLLEAWQIPETKHGQHVELNGAFVASSAAGEPGWDTHEIRSFLLGEEVLRQLMVLLLRSGVWAGPERRFDGLIGLWDPCSEELLAAMPEPRRDEILLRAFEDEHPSHAAEKGLRALRRFASRPLAAALAAYLESDAFRARFDAEDRRWHYEAWETVSRELPSGVARPLVAP